MLTLVAALACFFAGVIQVLCFITLPNRSPTNLILAAALFLLAYINYDSYVNPNAGKENDETSQTTQGRVGTSQ